jgi:zinc-RING finger domain
VFLLLSEPIFKKEKEEESREKRRERLSSTPLSAPPAPRIRARPLRDSVHFCSFLSRGVCAMSVHCNSCWKSLQGEVAYITQCSHTFCEKDARDIYNGRRRCPVCETELGAPGTMTGNELVVDDSKTIQLCGLSPRDILQVAQKAIRFHEFQAQLAREHSVSELKQRCTDTDHARQSLEGQLVDSVNQANALKHENNMLRWVKSPESLHFPLPSPPQNTLTPPQKKKNPGSSRFQEAQDRAEALKARADGQAREKQRTDELYTALKEKMDREAAQQTAPQAFPRNFGHATVPASDPVPVGVGVSTHPYSSDSDATVNRSRFSGLSHSDREHEGQSPFRLRRVSPNLAGSSAPTGSVAPNRFARLQGNFGTSNASTAATRRPAGVEHNEPVAEFSRPPVAASLLTRPETPFFSTFRRR